MSDNSQIELDEVLAVYDELADKTKALPDVILCHVSIRDELQRVLNEAHAKMGQPGLAPRVSWLWGVPIWTYYDANNRLSVLAELRQEYAPGTPRILEIK